MNTAANMDVVWWKHGFYALQKVKVEQIKHKVEQIKHAHWKQKIK